MGVGSDITFTAFLKSVCAGGVSNFFYAQSTIAVISGGGGGGGGGLQTIFCLCIKLLKEGELGLTQQMKLWVDDLISTELVSSQVSDLLRIW